MDFFTKMKV